VNAVRLGRVDMEAARLRVFPLFAGLADPELEAIAGVAGELEAAAGTVLTAEGDFGHGFFAVEAGEADVLQGDERIAGVGPGDVFGEIALLASGRRTASVVAVSPMRLITLFKRDLWRIEESYPALGDALRATVRERLDRSAAASDRG
jgi:CRP-like cAMP-binding protein